MPVLTLCALCALCIIILIICLLFSGIFPLFGIILTGAPGIIAICASCVFLAVIWRLLRLERWAWYGAAVILALLLVSTIITYSLHSYQDILAALSLPAAEAEALAKMPLQGYHIALLMSFPHIGGVIAAIISIKCFKR